MATKSVIIYNTRREPVADLHRAFGVGYEQRINEVHRAWFNLPIDDPHISECTGMRYAEIWNGDTRVDLFRIVRKRKRRTTKQTYYRFECEHVLVTLMDNRFQATTYSGPGTSTSIGDVLAEQGTANWQLGSSDFDRQFLYKWEPGTSLLEALTDIPKRFQCAYQLTFDTSSYPWTLNLIEPPATVTAYLDYSRNLKTIDVDEDFRGLYTRLYAYGAKAGEDQLDITGIEPSGYAYVENNVGTYGEIVGPRWSDQRYTIAQNLYDAAVDKLAEASVPKVTYTVSAADLYRLTGVSTDQFVLGALLAVNDEDMGITIEARIVSISKRDLDGKPGDVKIQIANKSQEFDLRRFIEPNDLSALQMVDIPGGVLGALPATPTEAGLYASTDHFGYSDGSDWVMYMDITGKLFAEHGAYYFRFDPAASPPLQIKADGVWLGSVSISTLTAGNLVVGMNLDTGSHIKSDNFVTGVSGWRINPDGSAEFQNATIRGSLNASDLDAGTINFATISRSGMSVIAAEIAAGAVEEAKIDSLAVTEGKIGNLAVTNAKIGNLAVDTAQIAALAVEEAKIGALAVTNAKIGLLAVDTAQIAALAVEEAKIGNLAVTNAKVTALDATKITTGTLVVARTQAKCTDATANNTATIINAGLVTTGTIQFSASGVIKAGMTAAGAGDAQIRIWAGATYANRATANFRVSQGGQCFATDFYTLTDDDGTPVISEGTFQGPIGHLREAGWVYTGTSPTSWTLLDLSGDVGAHFALVYLKVDNGVSANNIAFSPISSDNYFPADWSDTYGTNVIRLAGNKIGWVQVMTNSSGQIYWKASGAHYIAVALHAWFY